MSDKVDDIVEHLREQHKFGVIWLPENRRYVHYGEAADLIQSQQALIEEMSAVLQDVVDGATAVGDDSCYVIDADIISDAMKVLR